MPTKHEQFNCPLCNELIGPWSRGITMHARDIHGIRIEELWLLKNNILESPKCLCKQSCSAKTKWCNWEVGYEKYVKGHYDSVKRSSSMSESLLTNHWARGKTKDSDKRIKNASVKISESLTNGYSNGSITHWAKGKTKETHNSIKRRSEAITEHAYNKYNIDEIISLIHNRLDDRFTLLTTQVQIGDRKNNKEFFISFQCTRCNSCETASIYNVIRKRKQLCRNCDCFSSLFEEEIGNFIESLGVNVTRRAKISDCEIDVLVESCQFGIECNGLYWHSSAIQPNKNHHQHKSNVCVSNGVKLLHIFEDEWRDKKEVIKSLIRSRLKYTNRIYARKCSVIELDSQDRKNYFEINHLEGDVNAHKCFALITKDTRDIVCAISLRHPFHKQEGVLEVARFCSNLNVTVVGGLGKLISHSKTWASKQNYKKIITYVDTRLGNGTGYESVGFILDHISSQRFWWTDTVDRFNRFKFKANKTFTERQIADQNRVFKIYGCSNKVYSLSI